MKLFYKLLPKRMDLQLVVLLCAALGFCFLLFTLLTSQQNKQQLISSIKSQTGLLAQNIAIAAGNDWPGKKFDQLDNLITKVTPHPEFVNISLFDKQGKLISARSTARW